MSTCDYRNHYPSAADEPVVRSPAYHPFRASGRNFIYDYGSGQIVQVDEAVFASLCGHDAVGAGIDPAAATIEDMRAHGLLHRPQNELIVPPVCPHCGDRLFGECIEQLCLEVTDACNMRCRYCAYSGSYQNNRSHGQALMSWETARAAVDIYVARSEHVAEPAVSFYGGEPLLNFALIRRVVAYIREELENDRIRFSIDTNATLVEDDHIAFFIEHDFAVQISLDGPEDVHDANRVFAGGQGSFGKVSSVLDRIFARSERFFSGNVLVACTLTTPYPVNAIEEFMSSHPFNLLKLVAGFVDAEGVDLERLVGRGNDASSWKEFSDRGGPHPLDSSAAGLRWTPCA